MTDFGVVRELVPPVHPKLASAILEWVHAAGNPYFDWLFGDAASTILAKWQQRGSSEIALARTNLVTLGEDVIGGFIAMPSTELSKCRKADTIAMLKDVAPSQKPVIISKLAAARGLFAPPRPDAYYLSKIGVTAGKRGQGLGRSVVDTFMNHSRQSGYSVVQLDVSADNDPARRIYRSLGFVELANAKTVDGALDYRSLLFNERG